MVERGRSAEPVAKFASELNEVVALLNRVGADLHPSLAQFIEHEIEQRRPYELSAAVLSAAFDGETGSNREKRIGLATAIELLKVALDIHRLLLLQQGDGSIDRMLVGGTVLAGDFCFSRAAVLAAKTKNPQVVTIFSELLKSVSEASLRQTFADGAGDEDEQTLFFTGAAEAGSELARLPEEERQRVIAFASRLPKHRAQFDRENTGKLDESTLRDAIRGFGLPPHQTTRWQRLLGPPTYLEELLDSPPPSLSGATKG